MAEEQSALEEAMEESREVLKTLVDMDIPTFYGPSFPGPSIDKDGHIFVRLEFIPIKERVPTITGWRWVLIKDVGLPREALWEQCDLPGKSGWSTWEDGQRHAIRWEITHWSEIPEVAL